MRNQFILLLIFITSVSAFAQRHRIIKKEFTVNKNTSIVLNLDNISVAFEESTDGKIHFDYVMEFDGYSKKKMQSLIDNVSVELNGSNDVVSLNAKSKSRMYSEIYSVDSPHSITLNDVYFKPKMDSVVRKSKDSLLKEIEFKNRPRHLSSLKFMQDRFKVMKKDGKLKNLTKGSLKMLRSEFVIKLPPFVKLTINAKGTNLYFRNDIQNQLSITSKDGSVKAKAITNAYNKVKVKGANFDATNLIGGDYMFKNISKGKIGEMSNARINSEFSKIEIGEIGKQTQIIDFNSEYWFYNWSNNFERFNLYSEYSKIHLFYPKANHSMKMVGNNTKSLIGSNKFEVNMQPTKNGEKYTIMTKDVKDETKPINEIYFDIIHGIIYTHENSIKQINKD
ncbi:hypothetical protein [Winogradskyella sp.]|uniref:hypothetical protein n=1 Tax=Winogradskyella sp. TaxID=1883156 RepID=UPI0025F92D9E|nr:hypothetical protein [Winogradskyella sp.]MBT8245671.1 hypothetical protein [Winogradskyella sp.]